MNDTEYQFLLIENALRDIKQSYKTMPGRLDNALKNIRDSLDWIERHHASTGIAECYLKQLKEVIFYVGPVKDKSPAMAFQIHNLIKENGVLAVIGIKITFGTSDTGTPGMMFEGSRKTPTTLKLYEIPTILSANYKSPKKFIEWVAEHQISSAELSEKVENFAIIDLATVEMNELGLGEPDRKAPDIPRTVEVKEEKKPNPPKVDTTNLKPLAPPTPAQGSETLYGIDKRLNFFRGMFNDYVREDGF